MKTMTIRDLRQRWPQPEAALLEEEEILITRDSKPVAKLVRVKIEQTRRKRWDPEEHGRWQAKVAGRKMMPDSGAQLERNRAARILTG